MKASKTDQDGEHLDQRMIIILHQITLVIVWETKTTKIFCVPKIVQV